MTNVFVTSAVLILNDPGQVMQVIYFITAPFLMVYKHIIMPSGAAHNNVLLLYIWPMFQVLTSVLWLRMNTAVLWQLIHNFDYIFTLFEMSTALITGLFLYKTVVRLYHFII